MSIYKGSNVGSVYKGSSVINNVYHGSSVVYNNTPTLEGFVFRELSDDGVLSLPTGELPVFDWVTEIGDYEGYYGFYGCYNSIKVVSFPKLTSIGDHGLANCFYSCSSLKTVSFPSLTSISNNGLSGCFQGCYNLREVHFPKALEGNSECTASKMSCDTDTTVYFDL